LSENHSTRIRPIRVKYDGRVKMSGGVEWALHCCVALSGLDRPVSAAKMAEMTDGFSPLSSATIVKRRVASMR